MTYYRKKPVVIEAIRFLGLTEDDLPEFASETPQWMIDAMKSGQVFAFLFSNALAFMSPAYLPDARPGDWIIRGVNGELYPIKPDIFAATYEVAE